MLASGAGTNLQALIDASESGRLDAEIVAVFTNNPKAFALQRGKTHNIHAECFDLAPYLTKHHERSAARQDYDRALAEKVQGFAPDLVVLAGWMHLLSNAFLRGVPCKVINLHPALPGRFPGAHAIEDAWLAHQQDGLTQTGVMVHEVVDEGVDNGPVVLSQKVEISGDREKFEAKMHEVEHKLIVESVARALAKR